MKPRRRNEKILASLLVRREAVISERHARSAVARAIRALNSGNNIGSSLETEILLCISGSRQISIASRRLNPVGRRKVTLILVHRGGPGDRLAAEIYPEAKVLPFSPPSDPSEFWDLSEVATCTGDVEALVMERSVEVELERPTGI